MGPFQLSQDRHYCSRNAGATEGQQHLQLMEPPSCPNLSSWGHSVARNSSRDAQEICAQFLTFCHHSRDCWTREILLPTV